MNDHHAVRELGIPVEIDLRVGFGDERRDMGVRQRDVVRRAAEILHRSGALP